MRNLTKASREASREAQFTYLTSKGWERETYKGLDIFRNVADLLLKVYQGTAAEPILFYKYRNIESLTAKIVEVKKNYDSREAWKAEQKEKNKGKSSSHAATAAAIREELKKSFKGFKFSVTSEQFAGGDAVRISWINGPTSAEVEKITGNYQSGHFNGMEDIYEYSENPLNLPRVKYVTESRTVSEEIKSQIKTDICALMDFSNCDSYRDNPEQIAYRIACQTSFPAVYTSFKTVRNEKDSGSGYESFFKIEFEGVQEVEQPKEKTFEAVEVKEGEIQILEYSQYSFAVIGEKTREIKEDLYKLGGKFNRNLKCGAGYIFSNKNLDAVIEFLSSLNASNDVEQEQPQQAAAEEEKTTLKDEVNNMVEFFAQTDLKIYGEITPQTLEIARVQNYSRHPEFEPLHPLNICDPQSGQYKQALQEFTQVQEFDNLQDLEKAAKGGQVISLLNMYNLVNAR